MNDAAAAHARSQRLKAATRAAHEALDARIMAAGLFDSRARYAKFLRVQYRFHRDVDALYAHPGLAALLPDLDERRRLQDIAEDLRDLGEPAPPPVPARVDAATAPACALGWLYVAEGSRLGGAVLYRLAGERLGLGRDFGARHLAAHPQGAARHWRAFVAALDAAALSPAQERQAIEAAQDAFAAVRGYVEDEFRGARAEGP